ncbi:MAG: hypothetical protein ACHBN1_09330 [Heteroscytonema crispum UTEX LB 1556]
MKIDNLSAPRLHPNLYPLPPGRRQLNIIAYPSRVYLCALTCLFAPLMNAGATRALSRFIKTGKTAVPHYKLTGLEPTLLTSDALIVNWYTKSRFFIGHLRSKAQIFQSL